MVAVWMASNLNALDLDEGCVQLGRVSGPVGKYVS
jgi:hypothetical protein